MRTSTFSASGIGCCNIREKQPATGKPER